jgi:hypothetical protein
MKITEQWLIEHDACDPAIKLFNEQKRSVIDSDEVLDYLVKDKRFLWAFWLVEELLPRKYKTEFFDFYYRAMRNYFYTNVMTLKTVRSIALQHGRDLLKAIEKRSQDVHSR